MHAITETPFTPRTLEDGTRICEHCGEQIGMHCQHADGRIVCVRFTEDTSPVQEKPDGL